MVLGTDGFSMSEAYLFIRTALQVVVVNGVWLIVCVVLTCGDEIPEASTISALVFCVSCMLFVLPIRPSPFAMDEENAPVARPRSIKPFDVCWSAVLPSLRRVFDQLSRVPLQVAGVAFLGASLIEMVLLFDSTLRCHAPFITMALATLHSEQRTTEKAVALGVLGAFIYSESAHTDHPPSARVLSPVWVLGCCMCLSLGDRALKVLYNRVGPDQAHRLCNMSRPVVCGAAMLSLYIRDWLLRGHFHLPSFTWGAAALALVGVGLNWQRMDSLIQWSDITLGSILLPSLQSAKWMLLVPLVKFILCYVLHLVFGSLSSETTLTPSGVSLYVLSVYALLPLRLYQVNKECGHFSVDGHFVLKAEVSQLIATLHTKAVGTHGLPLCVCLADGAPARVVTLHQGPH